MKKILKESLIEWAIGTFIGGAICGLIWAIYFIIKLIRR